MNLKTTDHDTFYKFSTSYSKQDLLVTTTLGLKEVNRYVRGVDKPDNELVFKHKSGKFPRDIVQPDFTGCFLVSIQFKAACHDNKLTGCSFEPVKILINDGNHLDTYSLLVVTGRSGPIDFNKSRITYELSKAGKYEIPMINGLYFDIATWDGSDFVIPSKSKGLFVTEKAQTQLAKAELTNLEFVNQNEICFTKPPHFAI